MTSILDPEALRQIRVVKGPDGKSLLAPVIRMYLETTPDQVERLRVAITRADARGLRELAHSIRTSSDNLGARDLAKISRALELCGVRGDLAQASTLVGDLAGEFQRVAKALECELRESQRS
jgi:HPt (histidine-containing phosphotransfer) domain-containing protein